MRVPPAAEPPPFRIRFGTADLPAITPGLVCLAGSSVEVLFPTAAVAGQRGAFRLFASGSYLLGYASAPAGAALESNTEHIYRQMLALVAGRRLARIWNVVPAINGHRPDGLEHYRAFCSGRAAAFQLAWGEDYKRHVPSASAVGCEGDRLFVAFAATNHRVTHIENPLQVPAYEYPPAYGPRPPSFARATVVEGGQGSRDVFISGTSAIRGFRTLTPGDTLRQLDCTLENLFQIGKACGLGDTLGADGASGRTFRVYLRRAEDCDAVVRALEADLLRASDKVSYVRSDICRADLNLEIEVTVTHPLSSGN